MRTAHLIITYTNPKQTERMIRRMSHPDFDFYIHVDKKVDINSHLYLSNLGNVFFIKKRVDVKWAGYNTLKAIFNGVREICDTKVNYNFINLLSGQDYPLQSGAALADFFKANVGKEFISYVDFITEWEEGQLRYRTYHLANYQFKGRYLLEKIINRILPKRALPYGYHPYGKSMFWMLSPKVALYVVDKIENDSRLRRFFFYCWASDEFAFQTVLMNSEYRENMVNENYRYIDWSMGGAHPKLLVSSDFEKIRNSNMLFGRKFDASKDSQILDLIDSHD